MKRIFYIITIVIGIFIINNLARSTYELWSKKDVIVSAQKQLEAEKKENKDLKNRLEQAQGGGFIEEEARNKLLLVKPGEQNVFLPKPTGTEENTKKVDTRPNYLKWWEFFF